jgi:IS5 family transposase
MVYFRKRLTAEILGEINELVITKASEIEEPEEDKHEDDNDNNGTPEPAQNNGTLIVDATCAPSKIKFPQDTELLNEAREKLEKVIDELHDCADGLKPRTYRQKAHKDHLNIARKKKRSTKDIRKAISKQLRYIRRDFGIIDKMLSVGKNLTPKQKKTIEILKTCMNNS